MHIFPTATAFLYKQFTANGRSQLPSKNADIFFDVDVAAQLQVFGFGLTDGQLLCGLWFAHTKPPPLFGFDI